MNMTTQHWASLAVDPEAGQPIYDVIHINAALAHPYGLLHPDPAGTQDHDAWVAGRSAPYSCLRVLRPQNAPRGINEATVRALRGNLHRLVDPQSGIWKSLLALDHFPHRAPRLTNYLIENNRIRPIAEERLAETLAALSEAPDTFEVLVQVETAADQPIRALLEKVYDLLHASATTKIAIRDRIAYSVEAAIDPTPPAVATRNALLAEGWPSSRDVGVQLGSAPDAAEQRASRERAAGHLLGAWDTSHNRFVHPTFQFLADGRLHPRLTDLLAALTDLPGLSPAEDRGGWGRTFWLYQPRGGLSERSLAEAAAGDAPDADWTAIAALPDTPRTPAEAFADHPDAVIALVRMDAEAGRAA